MTPARLRECLDALGWSQRELARVMDVHYSHAHRWASGRWEIPVEVADRVEKMMRMVPGELGLAGMHMKLRIDDMQKSLIATNDALISMNDVTLRLLERVDALEKQRDEMAARLLASPVASV